jgi:hypothetical protein
MLISKLAQARVALPTLAASLFTLCLMAPNAVHAELEFKSEEVHQPITVVLNSSTQISCAVYGYSKNQVRLLVNTCEPYLSYSYVTSSGVYTDEVKLSLSQAQKLKLWVLAASAACPVTLKVDRNTFQIIGPVTSKCDPVAAVKTEDNQG